MKKLWEKIKAWFIKIFGIIKTWFIKNWLLFVNYLVVFISYSIIYGHEDVVWAELLLGLWIFVSIGYAGWKIFMTPKK